ncbi:MAG TPA: arginase [Azospirillaceae bacterium]|nr:arginase [Azospirillaceae bacterium]
MGLMGNKGPWFGLVGGPTEVGNVGCGAAEGPKVLRAAGLETRLRAQGVAVRDMGDVTGPSYDGSVDSDACRSLEATAAWCAEVRDACAHVLAEGGVPVMLGGDHSLGLGSVAAAGVHARARGVPLYVLWFDAHPDFNTPETSPSGNTHGLPAAAACGLGSPDLTGICGPVAALDPTRLFQFGIRSVDPGERDNLLRHGVTFHDMDDLRREGLVALVGRVLDRARAEDAHVHVSFDMDGLDPIHAPGVGTPVADGMDLDEVLAAMDLLGRSGLVGSFDLVEFAPCRDQGGATLASALRLLERFAVAAAGVEAVPAQVA